MGGIDKRIAVDELSETVRLFALALRRSSRRSVYTEEAGRLVFGEKNRVRERRIELVTDENDALAESRARARDAFAEAARLLGEPVVYIGGALRPASQAGEFEHYIWSEMVNEQCNTAA